MHNLSRLLIYALVILFALIGCKTATEEDGNAGSNNESTTNLTEEEDSLGLSETETSDSDNETTQDSGDLLKLGDIGILETPIGEFEATPTSVKFVEEMDEDDPYQTPDNGTFVIIDITITNIGDEGIASEDILLARLHDLRGGGMAPYDSFDSVDNFEGVIEPDETVTGQFLFDYSIEDTYQLSFGELALDSLSNEVRWEFDLDEVE
ncbi:protein of unknown function [Amphibacillus marinus]|uniref:DUF4352 domain-containing protein n=1 Tax=Amphibacillus marinus TaxID=872970 RepID=A0A1H8R3I6_9BACI|nr:DUF4352 domain-containing protein [Amphibacillus marinus]SEO60886.1 protein of unknown function [Amphibacillus marinus]